MNLRVKDLRDRLCKYSGEDYTIIQKCNVKIQLYFSLIGLLVLVILLCTFASALYFTEHLFHSIIANFGVGILWGCIITNMYVLFLYTISPTLLPSKIINKHEVKANKLQLSFSMGLRIVIVILLAIIIAQPLNVFILKPDSTALAFDIKDLLSTNSLASIITLAVVAVFLLPIYLKYNVRKLGDFYEKKAEIMKRIVEDDYKDFKIIYRQILERNISNYNKSVWGNLMPFLNNLEKVNPVSYQRNFTEIEKELAAEQIEKYEYWANPPYRTIHKSRTRNTLSEQDLLHHIYPEPD